MLGDRIKKERLSHKLSQTQLAKKLHVTQGAISQWENNSTRPDMELLSDLALLFNCSVDYLLGNTDTRVDDNLLDKVNTIPDELLEKHGNVLDAYRAIGLTPVSSLYHQRVPLIGKVAAGQPILAEENYDTFVDAPIDCDCALEIEGESMVPTYLPGDIVYIKHRQTVENGQVAVVLIDDEATLKHVYRDEAGLTLISDNPAFAPIRIDGQDHEYLAIYGVPVGYTRMYKKNKSGMTAK